MRVRPPTMQVCNAIGKGCDVAPLTVSRRNQLDIKHFHPAACTALLPAPLAPSRHVRCWVI